ncbi:MAG TPA: EAL domain-containing protein [Hyphomicrobium sp.]|nr:EAL domain-containing protein [Hyphomicrobium sp.]
MLSAFVNPFVSGRHRRLVGFLIWLVIATALLAAGAFFWRMQIQDSLRREARAELQHFDKVHANVTAAFDELHRTATATACSVEFIREMRRVAFRPDGLNEFMYAPHGKVTCSTSISHSQEPISLGAPDITESGEAGLELWINKRLDSVGLPGVVGTVVFQEPFALVIPPQSAATIPSTWVRKEIVISVPDGRLWHIGGEEGIFDAASPKLASVAPFSAMFETACGERHPHCVAMQADLIDIAYVWRTELAIAIALIVFYAIWPATVVHKRLEKYWSLESRFRRNLTPESVVCVYQPILDLRSGKISGCEVLARWRDVDGSIVSPDKFIDIVANSGQTLAFTKMVADRAFDELTGYLPQGTSLQINFNIFPRDLDSEKLRETFQAFDGISDRFPLALEIVESDALSVEHAQYHIEALARVGIRTYIDDFGSGYSSIHRVASLAIHGVKLDRSFAMAPTESLMARMLVHALDMVASSGREIVVEGVETQERLDLLIETGRVAYAQGYLISRPLPIDRLARFLADNSATSLVIDARAAA